MSLDSLTYLFEIYWPYMAGALAIGLASGWFSYSAKRR
jgi:uncharacterized membrane protein YbjE (DUF340 family)